MRKTKWTEQRNEFFQKRFVELFAQWKEMDKKNTQGEFARRICEIRNHKTGEYCPVTNRYVSEWLSGKWFPAQYIAEIAEVLGVQEDDFYFQTHDDLYRLSSKYTTNLGYEEMIPFCNEIGLDADFLKTIRKLMGSDFDSVFPTWTEIIMNPRFPFSGQAYIRRPINSWSESAEMNDDVRYFQHEIEFEENGEQKKKLILFTREDLRFWKDIQVAVLDYIEFLMMKRTKDMEREVEEVSRLATRKTPGGGTAILQLSIEDLNKTDKYHDYRYRYKEAGGENNGNDNSKKK